MKRQGAFWTATQQLPEVKVFGDMGIVWDVEGLEGGHCPDVMVVVGGKTSANTKHLAELAVTQGARAFHIESPDELQAEWFAGAGTVGLMSGASTPGWLVDQVAERMEVLGRST